MTHWLEPLLNVVVCAHWPWVRQWSRGHTPASEQEIVAPATVVRWDKPKWCTDQPSGLSTSLALYLDMLVLAPAPSHSIGTPGEPDEWASLGVPTHRAVRFRSRVVHILRKRIVPHQPVFAVGRPDDATVLGVWAVHLKLRRASAVRRRSAGIRPILPNDTMVAASRIRWPLHPVLNVGMVWVLAW